MEIQRDFMEIAFSHAPVPQIGWQQAERSCRQLDEQSGVHGSSLQFVPLNGSPWKRNILEAATHFSQAHISLLLPAILDLTSYNSTHPPHAHDWKITIQISQ